MKAAGLIALTAALRASAFLLPPNVAQASNEKHAIGYGLAGPTSPTNAVVQLPCSECAFSDSKSSQKIEENNEEEPFFWIQGGANSLLVTFSISEDGQRLQVNGETIYPLNVLEADIFSPRKTYVDQVRSGVSLADVEAGIERATPLRVTGHSVAIKQQDHDLLIPIEYHIYEIEGQPVSVDSISVKVLDLPDGLAIVTIEAARPTAAKFDQFFDPPSKGLPKDFSFPVPMPEFEEVVMPEFGRHQECNMLPAPLCRLRNSLEAKLMGMGKKGGCHGRKGGRPHDGKLPTHIRPHFHPETDEHDHPPHHGRPHHMRPHGHHGHHRHHFINAFARGLAAVLVPTMAGVAVGMTVSLVGLIFGRLIGFLWIKLYRGGRRGYASVALNEASADETDIEKDVVDEEPLPVYESAPAYEEIVKETK